ncbi:MAG: T9SS C-terminal target domain-containing protein, partial [Ignavibacteriales bacterium]
WEVLGFVDGKGTTSEPSEYIFIDRFINEKNVYRLKQIDYDGRFQYSEIVEVDIMTIFNFELSQNYPNPFNPATIISWQLPSTSDVKLKVFDITGRELTTLVNERLEEGSHKVEFNAAHLPSGVYLYSLQTGNRSIVRKMLLLK